MNILLAGKYFFGDRPLNQNIINFFNKKKIKILITEDKYNIDFLRKNEINFIINSGYGPIIKEEIINIYHNKIINMHNSYLPNGRGIYPNLWSIFCNYQSGITLCYLDKGIDTGDIILQKKVNFEDDNITLKESWTRLQVELSKTLIDNWSNIINPTNILKQISKKNEISYHNRKYSEALLKKFSKKWDTTHYEVKKIARMFNFSYEKFISQL